MGSYPMFPPCPLALRRVFRGSSHGGPPRDICGATMSPRGRDRISRRRRRAQPLSSNRCR
eukprot:5529221-Pyramimonas_sp.AAC.1